MIDNFKNASKCTKTVIILLGIILFPITLIALIFDLFISGFKNKNKKRILLGTILLSIITFIIIKNIEVLDYETNNLTYDETMDPIDYIDVSILDRNGSYLDINKGIFKDSLTLKSEYKIKLINTSKDAIFEGNVIFNNESMNERTKRGRIKLNPGQEKEISINVSNQDFTYSLSGGMKKFLKHDKYKILSQKVSGINEEFLSVAIEEPKEIKADEIADYFIKNYNNKDLVSIDIYIYPKDKEIPNVKDMHKDAKYDLTVERKDNKYIYSLFNINTSEHISDGEIENYIND